MRETKVLLDESDIPRQWYNVVADMPKPPAPPLGADGKPANPETLAAIFPAALIEQEISRERWIPIPEPVRETYRLWRPSPLFRAHRLEAALGTAARIYYKYEGVSPAGSHQPNTAVAQAFYNAEAGVRRLATETGAGLMGLGARPRRTALRDLRSGLYGASQLRAEALSPLSDGDLGRVLFFNLSGHGHFDMAAYDQYLRGELQDYPYPQAAIAASLERLPRVISAEA